MALKDFFKNLFNFTESSDNSSKTELQKNDVIVRCSYCGLFFRENEVIEYNGKKYCDMCCDIVKNDDDKPTDKMTYITTIGSSYSGCEAYYDAESQKLKGRTYMWHIDDSMEYTGWITLDLTDVVEEVMSDTKSDKLQLLYNFFGEEVDNAILKIKKQKSKKQRFIRYFCL